MTRLDLPEGSRKYRGDKFVMDDARGPHRADGVNVGRCEVNEQRRDHDQRVSADEAEKVSVNGVLSRYQYLQ